MIPLQIGFGLDDAMFLVPFFVLVLAMVALAGGITYLEHRKEMALIDAGMYDPEAADPRAWILGGGLVALALGLADVTTTLLAGGVPQEGVAATFVGLAALAYYFYKRRVSERPAPESATRS
ncbi:hypothetical protein SAMN04488063_1908 [Halopelagius inordinatus]|uniref:Uncharacterized protein n=1 Tax=Halopelagius inordinatus TaxID=553467 RepID=A0A1I2RLS6_9EURY|nr:hypothetical protein [Halopelagius inordinatus]SFG39577.1 hypothetical protein SAMN04488063_1908 [Halopelagius inordinatus]